MKMTDSQKQKLEWIDGALDSLRRGYKQRHPDKTSSRFSCSAMENMGGRVAKDWYVSISKLLNYGLTLDVTAFTDEGETGAGERYLWLAMLATLVKEGVDEGIFNAGENSI